MSRLHVFSTHKHCKLAYGILSVCSILKRTYVSGPHLGLALLNTHTHTLRPAAD
jgi:hypothetical protein